MKTTLYILFNLLFFSSVYADWTNAGSSINDDLSSVCFYNTSVGFVTGKKGIYQTTNGGTTAGSWTRIYNYEESNDSIVYNNCQFTGSGVSYTNSSMYFCGNDTVNHHAVIFSFNIPGGTLHLEYTHGSSDQLNDLEVSEYGAFAVGENGLLIRFDPNGNFTQLASPVSTNLNHISITNVRLSIAANGYLLWADLSATPLAFDTLHEPSRNFQSSNAWSLSGYATVSSQYGLYSYGSYNETHQYYADSIDGQAICAGISCLFVATGNGIYKTYNYTSILEYQPSSSGYNLSDISLNSILGTTLFAVGTNGTILYSTDSGGTPQPWADITVAGGCVNNNISISEIAGTVTDCYWSVDGVNQSGNCAGIYYSSGVTGPHVAQCVVSNSAFSHTIYKTFYVVDVPANNFPFTVSDSVLCHSQSIDLSLQGSESDVFYSLKETGSFLAYGNTSGTSLPVVLHSDPLSTDGQYYIVASSSLASCSSTFPAFEIAVEHTKADFHTSLINAEPGESVRFDQLCKEAQNYSWSFDHSPNMSTANSADVVNDFSGLGQTSVQLVAWSNNGCYDSIVKNGPFIYNETDASDSCYNVAIRPVLAQFQGAYFPRSMQLRTLANGGFLAAGFCDSNLFESHLGIDYQSTSQGCFIAKYSNSATLKWITYLVDTYDVNETNWFITGLLENETGEIYVSASRSTDYPISKYFSDNNGDSTHHLRESSLLKLDPNGQLIWDREFTTNYLNNINATLTSISLDKDYNIYATLLTSENTVDDIVVSSNGLSLDTIPHSGIPSNMDNYRHTIVKVSPSGEVIPVLYIHLSGANEIGGVSAPRFLFDSNHNIYLYGNVEGDINIYDTSQNLLAGWYLQGGNNHHYYLIKFDSLFNYQWKSTCTQEVMGNTGPGPLKLTAAALDNNDHIVLTGIVEYFDPYYSDNPLIITNNSDTVSVEAKGFFTARFDPSGICKWVVGFDQPVLTPTQSMLITSDTIKVLLTAGHNYSSGSIPALHFTSTDSTFVEISQWGTQIFVAAYDILGKLISVLESGTDSYNGDNQNGFEDHFQLFSDDSYLWSTDWRGYINDTLNIDHLFFTDTLFYLPISGMSYEPGVMTKFNYSCGILNYPLFITEIHDTVCKGTFYTFEDDSVQVITDSAFHESSYIAANGYDSLVRTFVVTYPVTNPDVLYGATSMYTPVWSPSYQWVNCDSGMTIISAASNAVFYPSHSGNYAVVIFNGSCYDTSDCYPIDLYYSSQTNEYICQGEPYVFPDGYSINVDSIMTHESNFTAQNGWDSTVVITIYPMSHDTMDIHLNTNSLNTTTLADSYQWLMCDGMVPLTAANSQVFQPTFSGLFAVVGHFGQCTDTSDCISFTVSIAELQNLTGNTLKIYPNPATNTITIEFSEAGEGSRYVIEGLLGEIIEEGELTGQTTSVNIGKLASGIYHLVVDGVYVTKIDKR